jgi:hypothetical protein
MVRRFPGRARVSSTISSLRLAVAIQMLCSAASTASTTVL